MRVALAVPCYVDQLRPQAARAALTLLRRLGCEVSLAFDAPCCGQPMFNAGVVTAARAAADNWVRASAPFDAIVMPSGSCTHHVRHHLPGFLGGEDAIHAAQVTFELCEFIAGPLGRDGAWSYEQDTVLKIAGNDRLFHHTDRNTLRKVGAPTPNWMMRAAQT